MIYIPINSCEKKSENKNFEELILKRIENIGNNLKISGYYYENLDALNDKYASAFCLYSNGILISLGSFQKINFFQNVEKLLTDKNFKNYFTSRSGWGIFTIQSTEITIENWGNKIATNQPYPAFGKIGKIIDNSTIEIYQMYKIEKKQKINLDHSLFYLPTSYHFREFSPKPDSTNNFIP